MRDRTFKPGKFPKCGGLQVSAFAQIVVHGPHSEKLWPAFAEEEPEDYMAEDTVDYPRKGKSQ